MVLPKFEPIYSSEMAVKHSSYKIICKPDLNLRVHENKFAGKIQTESLKDQKVYSWQTNNTKAIRKEPFLPDRQYFLTSVEVVPEHFSFGGKPGSFNNWGEFSKWMGNTLLKGRDKIPAETAAYIRNLIKDIPDVKQKAKKIYEYMQQKRATSACKLV